MDEGLDLDENDSGNDSDVSSVASNLHDEEIIPWFFTREDIETTSPSRRDGIDLNMENSLRNSYCAFLDNLGERLKLPQVTIATATVFCHRFFIRQSHAKNDRWTIATVCILLAGKVVETPVDLKDVIIASYEIIHKKELSDAQKKEVYEQQKELVLSGEDLVLSTLNFDLYISLPYIPLVEAIKRFMVDDARTDLAQLAWNFVNDCRRTTLCLQYKPDHIAAGVLFLAAELLNMDLQSYGEVLCQDFDIPACQLEDIRGQIHELYERKHIPTSQESKVESSGGVAEVHQHVSSDMASTDKRPSSDIEGGSSKINLSQSDDRDDHSVHTIIVETSDDAAVSQLEKDLQVLQEEVDDAKQEKDKKSFDKEIDKRDLMDEKDLSKREAEEEDSITRRQSFMNPDDNTSVEHSEILDANHSGVDG